METKAGAGEMGILACGEEIKREEVQEEQEQKLEQANEEHREQNMHVWCRVNDFILSVFDLG